MRLDVPCDRENYWFDKSRLIQRQAICAKSNGEPCCDWVGEDGSGHFVKMVHNGIEYGDMQLICEAYNLMKDTLGCDHDEMSDVFKQWNGGELDSFLIEISANILAYKVKISHISHFKKYLNFQIKKSSFPN